MDWGIIGSVVVANVLMILGIMVIFGSLMALMVSGINKKRKEIVPAGDMVSGEAPVSAEQTEVKRS